jgi:hypothetical protein
LVTKVPMGGRAPATSTWPRQADLLVGLAQRGLQQVLAGVAAAAGERDLASVAAQVVLALGEDKARGLGPAVHGDQDSGLGATALGVHRRGLVGIQQHPGEVEVGCHVP